MNATEYQVKARQMRERAKAARDRATRNHFLMRAKRYDLLAKRTEGEKEAAEDDPTTK